MRYIPITIFCAILLFSCRTDPLIGELPVDNTNYNEIKAEAIEIPVPVPLGFMVPPEDNPLTAEGIELGRMLFYETDLSEDRSMSCASCHHQKFAFTDSTRFSQGVNGGFGNRNSMPIFNLVWQKIFFWDGRAASLREQSLLPIESAEELNISHEEVVARLKERPEYVAMFEKVFVYPEITAEKMGLAMEQFMHSIISGNSKFDKSVRREYNYTASEARGRRLWDNPVDTIGTGVRGAGCFACHDDPFFNLLKPANNGLDGDHALDPGYASVTGNIEDFGTFKAVTLRNVELTGPYMHDGRFETLEEVIEHYNSGVVASSTLHPRMKPYLGGIGLTAQEKADLVAFLKTLTDTELTTNPAYAAP